MDFVDVQTPSLVARNKLSKEVYAKTSTSTGELGTSVFHLSNHTTNDAQDNSRLHKRTISVRLGTYPPLGSGYRQSHILLVSGMAM